jgi:hypothetical protein
VVEHPAALVLRDLQRDQLVLPLQVFQLQAGDSRQGFERVGRLLEELQAASIGNDPL